MADSFLEQEDDGAISKTKYTSDDHIGGIFLDEIYDHAERHETDGDDTINFSSGKNLIQHSAFFDVNGDDLPVMWALEKTPTLVIAPATLFPERGGNQITITSVGDTSEGIEITG